FILAFEGSVRVGDRITLDDRRGYVTALHARYVAVRTEDGPDILVPNENLVTSTITNWSYSGEHKMRIRARVRVGYDADLEQALSLVTRVGAEHPRVVADPPPETHVIEFAESSI